MSSPSLAAGQKPYTPRAVSSFLATIRSSSCWASSNSLRAASPTFGSSKIRGYLPFSSQVMKERRPVDVRARASSSGTFSSTRGAGERRLRNVDGRPIGLEPLRAALRRTARALPPAAWRTTRRAAPAARDSRRRASARASGLISFSTTPTRPRRIEHVDHRLLVLPGRSSPPCAWRWSSRRRSTAAAQRRPLHLAGDVDHLVEARRDQAREADDVDAFSRRPSRESSRTAPSRPGRSLRSCCSRAPRRRCSCRCRGRRL